MLKGPAPFDQGLFLMHLHKGKEYFDQDQLQKAREELEAAYHLRPQDEKALNMLGMTYFKLEMLPQAEEMYVTLSSNNPEIYTLHVNLGLIRLKLDKLEQAKESLYRALELQPGNSKAHFYLGLLYEKKEEWEEALHHFEQAKAERMIGKMKAKIEEQKSKEDQHSKQEELVPFEVLEVLTEQFSEAAENSEPFSDTPPIQENVPQSETVFPESASADLAQAIAPEMKEHKDRIEPQAVESPEKAAEWSSWVETNDRMKLRNVLDSIPNEEVVESEEEELIEDLTPDEAPEDTSVQETDPEQWEKTKPGLIAEDFIQPEVIQQMESSFFSSNPQNIEEPFFIGDEIAADISTFLAQSRTEQEEQEEDIFPIEPQSSQPSLTDSTVTQEVAPPKMDFLDNRIPTPDEVENEVADSNKSENEEGTSEGETELISELRSDVILVPLEPERTDTGQDLQAWDESHAEEAHIDDDEPASEGFLTPSPLTPTEEPMEQTQAMSMPPDLQPSLEPSADDQTTIPEPVEPSPVETKIQHEEPSLPAGMFQPANLDQFSRDRFYIQPLIGADRFLLIDPHLLEAIISDQLICRLGTISSYTGSLQFQPWAVEYKDQIPLVQVRGSGVLFLADKRKEIFLLSLNNEVLFVESHHLLMAQSALKVEPHLIEENLCIIKISGRGTVALTCQTKPLSVTVHQNLPANIPAHAVIAWSGDLKSEILQDEELRKILVAPGEQTLFLHFSGIGDVVVEQGGLWGSAS